jgi:hypothetical protein
MLTALTDDEVATGVRRLRATPDETAVLVLSLIVLRRDPATARAPSEVAAT